MPLLCVVPVTIIHADSNLTAIFTSITSLAISPFILSSSPLPFYLLYFPQGKGDSKFCYYVFPQKDTLILKKYFCEIIETAKEKISLIILSISLPVCNCSLQYNF